MNKFQNILFISNATSSDEASTLAQALSLARNNKATLTAVIITPELPDKLGDYKKAYEQSMCERLQKSIESACAALKLADTGLTVKTEIETGGTPADRIVRRVLRNDHDLVIKEADVREGGKGFKALDMELLRKCPCPVWLSRPIQQSRNAIKVAVAIDPESEEQAAHDLSVRMLQLSRALADTCSGELNIVSCWHYEFEEYLRGCVWFKISKEELERNVSEVQTNHHQALDAVIQESGIGGNIHIHHMKGMPEKIIPDMIRTHQFDILVMGTVARTGIPGIVLGNTAEDVLQKIECSLLALKPNGFISPVKAYD